VIKLLLSLALQETQCHQHFWTCRKKKYCECRVHYPLSSMHTIRILGLFQMNWHINLSKTFIENKYKHFFETKKEMGMGNDSSFDDFLNIFKLNGKTYILIWSKNLTKPQIFLHRSPKNIYTMFVTQISHIWYANSDIQFKFDPYATTSYCTS
jgi:hypothetical protein